MKIKRLNSYHWLRLPGLCNNNEKLGSPERLSAGIQFGSGTYFTKKYRVIVIVFVRVTWSYYYPEILGISLLSMNN